MNFRYTFRLQGSLSFFSSFLVFLFFGFAAISQNLTRPNIIGPSGLMVNSYTGNLFIQRTDMVIPGRIPLEATFSYNSADASINRGYGNGWSFRYGSEFAERGDTVIIIGPDGRRDKYLKVGSAYKSPKGFFDSLTKGPTGYRLYSKYKTSWFFDLASRKATSYTDRNGNKIQLTLSGGLITQIADDQGRTLTLSYTANRLTSLREANGGVERLTTYQYDAAGNLIRVTDPLGNSFGYQYTGIGMMNTHTDRNGNAVNIIYSEKKGVKELISCIARHSFSFLQPKPVPPSAPTRRVSGNVIVGVFREIGFLPTTKHNETVNGQTQTTTYNYDEKGNLIKKVGNCCGFNTTYAYDDDNNIYSVTDANGNVTKFTYDAHGNLISETDPNGAKVLYQYEGKFNNLVSRTDKKGNATRFEYDASGNLVKISMPLGIQHQFTYNAKGDRLSWTDGRGNPTTFTYDAFGNLTQVNRLVGVSSSKTYDIKGRLLSETDPRGFATSYEYDALNRITKITDPLTQSITRTYDANGNLLTEKDRKARTTFFAYDGHDRLVKITDPAGKLTQFGYDEKGNLIKLIDPNGNLTTKTYSQFNLLTSSKNALGETTTYEYDGNGNLTVIHTPNGNDVRMQYDKLDRLIKSSDGLGDLFTRSYDLNDNLIKETDALGNTTTSTYDALNRRTSSSDALGNSSSFTYDNNYNLTGFIDRNGKPYTNAYDELNRRIKQTDPLSFEVKWTYDLAGNLTGITDQNNKTTSYTYDNLNRKTQETFADGSHTDYQFDAEGNITRRTDARSLITNYSYDLLDRLTLRDFPGANDDAYTYDAGGRMLTANNANATITFIYDAADRVLSETLNGKTTGYSYNVAGRSMGMTYPGGRSLTRKMDVRDRLTNILDGAANLASFSYDAADRKTAWSYPNGTSATAGFDAMDRLISLSYNPSGFLKYGYGYDKEGNLNFERKLHDPAKSQAFSYDFLNRLTGFKQGTLTGTTIPSPATQTQYNYDGVGNRTSLVKDGQTTGYTVNDVNAYTALTGTGAATLTYDASGNLLNDGSQTYTYDAENRILAVNGGITASYLYDALGRRIRKTTGGAVTNYFYAEQEIIEERNASDAVVATYVYGEGLDEILNMKRGGKNYFYHHNHLGSVVALTNASGQMVEQYGYDAFGQITITDSAGAVITTSVIGNVFTYTSRVLDFETSNYQYRFRDYSAGLGRFKQRDPLGFADDLSHYTYVGDNPLTRTDPLGQSWFDEFANSQVGGYLADLDLSYLKPVNDILAGFSDKLTFGATNYIREQLGTNSTVSKCSKLYNAGSIVGGIYRDVLIGQALLRGVALARNFNSTRNLVNSVETTTHGAERIAGAAATRGGVLSAEGVQVTRASGKVLTQSDGATVYLHEVSPGRFNAVVQNESGKIITTMENWSKNSINRIGKKYGWSFD